MKRISLIFVICLCLSGAVSLCAAAQDSTEMEYYSEYDDYYAMEQDYLDSVLDDEPAPENPEISVPAMVLGAAAAAGIAFLFLRKRMRPPEANPYFRPIKAEYNPINKSDNKTER